MAIKDEQEKQRRAPQQQIVIPMKGHPGTGKSTVAHSLASALRIPLIDKDDILRSTLYLPNLAPSALLNDMSYEAIWHLASTQLRIGLSLVVDSPLSRRSHLNNLLHIASSHGARVVVVECRASDEEEWWRRVDSREREECASWHKPFIWREIERLLDSY